MKERDCENCVHHTDNGCSSWDCEYKPNDLISRADAIELAVDVETPKGTYESAIYVDDLMALPSANAKQGKWLTDKGKSLMICSVCGTLFNKHTDFFDFEEFANFCPYCGAIMKGGDSE